MRKSPRMSRRASRLFAVLMRDCHDEMRPGLLRWQYRQFLKGQANHADANCPYRQAAVMLRGRA